MSRSTQHNRRAAPAAGFRTTLGACALFVAAACSGCVSPYGRCVSPYETTEAAGPPGPWVQRNTPLPAAPVEYEQRTAALPPIVEMPPTVPLELSAPVPAGPETPPLPGTPELQLFPPLAPAAEDEPAAQHPPAAEPVVTQSMLDELSGQIVSLNRRVDEQAAALLEARRQSDAARQATQSLESKFDAWRAELDVVRDTIQTQTANDLQTLDELNHALEQLLSEPTMPESSPGAVDSQPMTTRRGRRGVSR